jgi:hypothetical protein
VTEKVDVALGDDEPVSERGREHSRGIANAGESRSGRRFGRGTERSVRCRGSLVVAAATGCLLLAVARPALADPTTWLALGGGLSLDHSTVTKATNFDPAFSATMGVGTSPVHSWVIGGVFRSLSRFNEGGDISLALRVTTGSFSRGDWGFGFDLGPGLRLWGNNAFGTFPLEGVVLLGAPWGFQVSLGADIVNLEGTPSSLGGYAVIEFDLLRFTLNRQGSTDAYWKNPLPLGGRMPEPPHQ